MNATLTSVEAMARTLTPGQRLGTSRQPSYDAEYAIFHLPLVRRTAQVDPGPMNLPSDEWVAERFAEMVVGEQPRTIEGSRPPRMLGSDNPKRIDITSFPLDRYLEACEYELVFGGLVDNLIGDPGRPTADKFISIVSNRHLGNTANRRNANATAIGDRFSDCLDHQAPVQLLLPAMPFKDQCPFRTEAPADHPDLGEAAFLVRMHCLALAINQIHNFDCECIIVSDGLAYAPIFDVDPHAATRYLERLRRTRDELNLGKSIHFLDLLDVVDLDTRYAAACGHQSFAQVRRAIRTKLDALRSSQSEAAKSFDTLAYGMKWNLNTRALLETATHRDLWSALRRTKARASDRPTVRTLFSTLTERSTLAALDYASFNLALRFCNLLGRYFPDAIRLTSHPKAGQVAAPRFGSTYPWNGVAVASTLDPSAMTLSSITCMEAFKALRSGMNPIFDYSSPFPIGYLNRGSE